MENGRGQKTINITLDHHAKLKALADIEHRDMQSQLYYLLEIIFEGRSPSEVAQWLWSNRKEL